MATGISNGKTKKNSFDDEYFITYKNKEDASVVKSRKYTHSSKYLNVNGGDNLNRLFFGDNLDVLRQLSQDENIKGKVMLVYIDPPFATYSNFINKHLEEAYEDNLFGSEYVEFIRKRLILIKELMHEQASIYVHLDENMAFTIKMIMDEVFGKSNFRNWITRVKCNRKNTTKKRYGNISDYIMFYTKSSKYVWNRPLESWKEEDIVKQYPYIDANNGLRFKKVPIHAPGVRNGETGKEWRGMLPPKGKHWQYLPSKLDEMDRKGEIYWSVNGNPRRKIYFTENTALPVQDIWHEFKDIINQNTIQTGYPTEKNLDLIRRIISASTNPNDLVLDAFCGSGTTLIAATELSRNWIGIDSSELAIVTTYKRLLYGSNKHGDYVTNISGINKKLTKSNVSFSLYISDDKSENTSIKSLIETNI